MTERQVGIVEKVVGFFRRGNDSGEILLGRVPEELRRMIWQAPTTEIRSVVSSINEQLVSLGIEPIRGREFKDAIEGNEFMHSNLASPSQH